LSALNLVTLEKDLSSRDRLATGSRYETLARIASGGMGTVYLGRLRGPAGFRRLVALKRAHEHLVRDEGFAKMFRAEARVASRLHHPNVVAVHDIEELDDELVLVMDYVQGGALSSLLTATQRHPLDPQIALRILLDAAAGLEAAHTLTDERGRSLGVVHRDVSPENVLVGTDGVARISDFGVAKILRATIGGATDGRDLKGKIAYMAPECIRRGKIDARSDVFALGVVAWEALTERRLFRASSEVATLQRVIGMTPEAPSALRPGLPQEIDAVVLRALDKMSDARWPSARAFADALEAAAREGGLAPATHAQVGEHVWRVVGHVIDARHRVLSEDRPRTDEPLDEASGIRITASIPRHIPTLPDSVPSGLVREPSITTATPPPRAAWSTWTARVTRTAWTSHVARTRRVLAGAGTAIALFVTLAILATADPEPTYSVAHRALAVLTPRRSAEMGGVLPEVALPELPQVVAPTPAPTPRPIIRYVAARPRVVRAPAAPPAPVPPQRDLAPPDPYASSSSLR
jgi:eukaryotic-like serine/threonine-protein kinase